MLDFVHFSSVYHRYALFRFLTSFPLSGAAPWPLLSVWAFMYQCVLVPSFLKGQCVPRSFSFSQCPVIKGFLRALPPLHSPWPVRFFWFLKCAKMLVFLLSIGMTWLCPSVCCPHRSSALILYCRNLLFLASTCLTLLLIIHMLAFAY